MIYLEYDPNIGHAYTDGECEEVVRDWIEDHNDGTLKCREDDPIWVGTANVIHALRVAIKQGAIKPEDVFIEFMGKRLNIFPNGGIRPWPKGFCDHIERWMRQLL